MNQKRLAPSLLFLMFFVLLTGCGKPTATVEPSTYPNTQNTASSVTTDSAAQAAEKTTQEVAAEVTATTVPSPQAVEKTTIDVPAKVTVRPAGKSSSWKAVSETQYTFKNYYTGFLNEKFGIVVGYAGEIHYTTDGGKTWPRSSNGSLCRFGLDIVNEDVSWNCGNGAHVRVSTDKGKTFEAVADFGGFEPNQCRYISFLDKETGWVASPKKLGHTTDGAKTWQEIALPGGLNEITAMDFRTALDGYLLDSNGILFTTADGAKTWTSQDLDFKKLKFFTDNLSTPAAPVATIRFTDANEGTLAFAYTDQNMDYHVSVMDTNDGGKTWQLETLPLNKGAQFTNVYLSKDRNYLTLSTSGLSNILKRK